MRILLYPVLLLASSFLLAQTPEELDRLGRQDLQVLQGADAIEASQASSPSATPVLTTQPSKPEKVFNPRASHWLISVNAEQTNYETGFKFDGEKKDIDKKDMGLYGLRTSFGGEFHLGGGMHTATKVEGYYLGSLFSTKRTAGPEETTVEVAYTKDTGMLFGVDAVQTLSWMWDFKTKNPFMDTMHHMTLEPFVEAGIGYARAFTKTEYAYNLTSSQESYLRSHYDQLANAKIGAGFNLLASNGYFFFIKATQNRYEVLDRKVDGYEEFVNQDRSFFDEKAKDVKLKAVTIFSLGGGYKF